MYLSNIQLTNWRSYADTTFKFKQPTRRRPLVLIGAMNGHGKTSLLLALYLGLFGRFGLRHVEGFSSFKTDDLPFYRDAIRRFRRNSATPDEPTMVDISFSSVAPEDNDETEIRVVRRWFFGSDGKPRQGDSFETVELYINGRPQKLSGVDAAIARIERYLFPANFMPAFFFDGEQAQMLVNNAAESGIKKSVEVLFGTKILDEVDAAIKQYINQSRLRIGGTRNVTSQQKELDGKLAEREKLEEHIVEVHKELDRLQQQRASLERDQQVLSERLNRLGGANKTNLEELSRQLAETMENVVQNEEALTGQALLLGPALAVSRLAPAIFNRLKSEYTRERWENLREGTMTRADEVLRVALPEPPESDYLLGSIDRHTREKVKARFRLALEQIYHPPPEGCATEYLLGHVKGEMRDRLVTLLTKVTTASSNNIKDIARRVQQAREARQDAEARHSRLSNLPREVQEIAEKLKEVSGLISENSRHLGSNERDLRSKKATLEAMNAEIGKLQESLASLGPDQQRIAIAERVHRSLAAVIDEIKPITLKKIQELVASHFVAIADRRYKNAKIVFPDDGSPLLQCNGHPDQLIESMSGFERRAFGIAFSLALAEMTRVRVPLVIDTPMGNADTEYRPRLLKALTNVDLDQIVILTHDAEVTGPLLEAVDDKVQQTFLVEFDREQGQSTVTRDAFFV